MKNTSKFISYVRTATFRALGFFFLITFVTGCASFPVYKIPKVEISAANKQSIHYKPTIYISIRFMQNLSSGDGKSNVEVTQPLPRLKHIVEKTAHELEIFNRFSFESHHAKNMDYILEVEMLNYGSGGAAFLSGFITGLSGLPPCG
jgi:hypothetical protein